MLDFVSGYYYGDDDNYRTNHQVNEEQIVGKKPVVCHIHHVIVSILYLLQKLFKDPKPC